MNEILDWKVRIIGAPGYVDEFDATLRLAPMGPYRWIVEDSEGNYLVVPSESVHVYIPQSV